MAPTIRDAGRMSAVRIRRREAGAQGDWPENYPPLLRALVLAARRGWPGAGATAARRPAVAGSDAGHRGGDRAARRCDFKRQPHRRGRRFRLRRRHRLRHRRARLRMLGARNLAYAVPNRAVHGYGLTPALVEELASLQPDLLVTVDHGIACHAGIAAAALRGWRVLVTDHHLPGETLPDANAIVNPALPGHAFGNRALAGVGVLFYLLLALRKRLRERGRLPSPEPDLPALLDLVAVGTVADLVPLDACNRALVSAGLRRLRTGQGCAGVNALAQVAARDIATLSAGDIGFGIAPRINAAGRLPRTWMPASNACPRRAGARAGTGESQDAINRERRALQQQTTDEAKAVFASISPAAGDPPVALQPARPAMACRRGRPGRVEAGATRTPGGGSSRRRTGRCRIARPARSISPGLHIRDVPRRWTRRTPAWSNASGGPCDGRRAHAGGVEPARCSKTGARTVAAMPIRRAAGRVVDRRRTRAG